MSYRIRTKDVILEVDTLEEYQDILRLLGILTEKPKAQGSSLLDRWDNQSLSKESKIQNFYKLVSETSDLSLEILKALGKNSNGLSDTELRMVLGIEGPALGGAFGGITKKAKDSGLRTHDILLKKPGGGYQLTEMMWNFIQSKDPEGRAYKKPSQENDAGNI